MVRLGIIEYFKCYLLEWYGTTVPMKEPWLRPGEPNIAQHKIQAVVMHTEEKVTKKE